MLSELTGLATYQRCGRGGATHAGLAFDMAIRLYLESFRLPGEAQKINRIMESFGKHYHEQCPDLFKNADAVYILGYSVILLNTDQHNVGVSWSCTIHLVLCRPQSSACWCNGLRQQGIDTNSAESPLPVGIYAALHP